MAGTRPHLGSNDTSRSADDPISRASALMELRRDDMALAELQRATSADPTAADAWALASLCHLNLNRPVQAVESAKRALELAPELPAGHYAMAKALVVAAGPYRMLGGVNESVRLDQLREAERHARETIRRAPTGARPHALLAEVLLSQNELKKALQATEQGLSVEPTDVTLLTVRGDILRLLGRTREAADVTLWVLQIDAVHADAHTVRGWSLLETGNPAEAMTHFATAVDSNPNNEYARVGLIEAMKARSAVYRVVSRLQLAMERPLDTQSLVGKAIVAFTVVVLANGMLVGSILLMAAGIASTTTVAILMAALGSLVFVFLSMRHLFTIMMFLNPASRRLLTPRDRLTAIATITLGAAVIGFVGFWVMSR